MANEGIYGSDVRTEVKNPLSKNLGQAAQPNSISLSGVSGPSGADFSQVGEGQRVISKLLGEGAGMLDSYVESNRSKWELDGKLAYAQGVTEQEIMKSGDKYNIAGFLTMKTETASTQFATEEAEYIKTAGREQSPDAYRDSLNAKYAAISEQSGSDPFVQRLVGASAANTMPKLMAQQVVAHNTWVKEQQTQSFIQMGTARGLSADSTPEGINEILNPEVSGLPIEDHKAAVLDILSNTLLGGDTRFRDTLANKPPIGSPVDAVPNAYVEEQAIDYVMKIEGGYTADDAGAGPTNLGINSGANPDINVKDLTPEEARTIYKERYWTPVVTDEMSPAFATVAFDGSVNQGPNWTKKAVKAANGDLAAFFQLRRERYIQTAKLPGKAKFLPVWLERLDKLEEATSEGQPMARTVEGMVDQKRLVLSMAANGFSEAQIKQATSASNAYTAKQELAFDQNRILTEQALMTQARKEGNLPALLAQIADTQQANGYSDRWANEMANSVIAPVNEREKTESENKRIDSLAAVGHLSSETADKQRIGIDRRRAEIISKQAQRGGTEEQQQAAIQEEMTSFLVSNSVVDPTWKKSITAGLNADVLKDGKVNPETVEAYEDLKYLRNNTPRGYAENYISSEVRDLFSQAEALDTGANSQQAILIAQQMQSRNKNNPDFKSKKVDHETLLVKVKDKIESELNPGFTSFYDSKQAANAFDVRDSDIKAWKNNPTLIAWLTTRVNAKLAADIKGTLNADGAVNSVLSEDLPNVEFAPSGNVLISRPGKGLKTRLGFPTSHNTHEVFHLIQDYMKTNAVAMFGPAYKGPSANMPRQLAIYNDRQKRTKGDEVVPAAAPSFGFYANTRYELVDDPDSNRLVVQLTKEDADGNYIAYGEQFPIPDVELSSHRAKMELTNRNRRTLVGEIKSFTQDAIQGTLKRTTKPEDSLSGI